MAMLRPPVLKLPPGFGMGTASTDDTQTELMKSKQSVLRKKRHRTSHVKSAFILSSMIIKKFCKLTLSDDPENLKFPPYKRRRLSYSWKQRGIAFFQPVVCSLPPSVHSISDSKTDLVQQNKPILRKSNYCPTTESTSVNNQVPIIPKSIFLGPDRRLNQGKRRTKFHGSPNVLPVSEFAPLKVAQDLRRFFERCVLYIPHSRLQVVHDVDAVIREICSFGRVFSIQDHWARRPASPGGIANMWEGCLVTYRNREDCNYALKYYFLVNSSSMKSFCVPSHLMRIGEMEAKWLISNHNATTPGTCVRIEGFHDKIPWYRIIEELKKFGMVIDVLWSKEDEDSCWTYCEVIYRFTVEAVAAALAMDGKSFFKSVLRARLKINAKERAIHMKVCESY